MKPISALAAAHWRKGSTLFLSFGLVFVTIFSLHTSSPFSQFATAKLGPRTLLESSILRSAWKPFTVNKNSGDYQEGPVEQSDELTRSWGGRSEVQLAEGTGNGNLGGRELDPEGNGGDGNGNKLAAAGAELRDRLTRNGVFRGHGLGVKIKKAESGVNAEGRQLDGKNLGIEFQGQVGDDVEAGEELERGESWGEVTVRSVFRVVSEDDFEAAKRTEPSRSGLEKGDKRVTEEDSFWGETGMEESSTHDEETLHEIVIELEGREETEPETEAEAGAGKETQTKTEAEAEAETEKETETETEAGAKKRGKGIGTDSLGEAERKGETEPGPDTEAETEDDVRDPEDEVASRVFNQTGDTSAETNEDSLVGTHNDPDTTSGAPDTEKVSKPLVERSSKISNGATQSEAADDEPQHEAAVAPDSLPSVSLILPSKLDECKRARISLVLQSESSDGQNDRPKTAPLQTPPIITLVGADPDAPHYEVYPFQKWHALLCPVMNWSDCAAAAAPPPKRWERALGVTFQGKRDPPVWEAEFFPDVSALSYAVAVSGARVVSHGYDNGTVLENGVRAEQEAAFGAAENGLKFNQTFGLPKPSVAVWEAEGTCRQPWNRSRTACQPLLNKLDLPRAQDFEIVRLDERSVMSPEGAWDLQAGETVSFLVRPIPVVQGVPDRNLRDGFCTASFNAILESDTVIQHAAISQTFDEGLGGYAGTLVVHDSGDYALKVALHWIHGTADLYQEPFPTSVSSHMQHMYSQCEDARSLVHGSPVTVHVDCDKSDTTSCHVTSETLTGNPDLKTATEADSSLLSTAETRRRTDLERELTTGGLTTEQLPRCKNGDLPGRWLNLPVAEECRPPVCSGNRSATNVVQEWNGNDIPWVYAPYGCQYHMFSLGDITACAGNTGVKWIHVVGDSTVREIPSTLFTMDPEMEPMQGRRFEFADRRVGEAFAAAKNLQTLGASKNSQTTKREAAGGAGSNAARRSLLAVDKDQQMDTMSKGVNKRFGKLRKLAERESESGKNRASNGAKLQAAAQQESTADSKKQAPGGIHRGHSPLRVTFQFFDQMYPMETGTHRDFAGMDRPLLDQFNVTCPAGAHACPDVIILSPAMAYALWKQNGSDFKTWVTDFAGYVAAALAAPRGPRHAPLRAIWYRSPFMYSQAHERSSPYISLPRLLTFDEAATKELTKLGVEVFDAMTPTRTRPGTCYDGLHYLMATADGHMGHTSNMLMQMLLNTVFDRCTQVDAV